MLEIWGKHKYSAYKAVLVVVSSVHHNLDFGKSEFLFDAETCAETR
jgi:hypothetical protein